MLLLPLIIIGLGFSFGLGFLCVALIWPAQRSPISNIWCRMWFGIGIGLGLSSVTSLFTLVIAGSAKRVFLLPTETLLLVIIASLLWSRHRHTQVKSQVSNSEDLRPQPSSTLFMAVFWFYVFSVILAGITFTLWTFENPHGGPDAWTFWNLRARLFWRSGEFWLECFTRENWTFPTYPQLLPMNVVRLWSFAGKEALLAPASLAFLFTFATIGVLTSSLGILRGYKQALVGGLLLSGTPFFIRHGASQYADVPFGFYMLATLAALNLADRLPQYSFRLIGLAGLSAGFAAWTKNEGILFVGCILLAQVTANILLKRPAIASLRSLLALMAGLLPGIAVLLYYRSAVVNYDSALNIKLLLSRLSDISRYIITAKAFLRHLIEPYSLVYSTPIAIIVLYAFFLGVAIRQLKNPGFVASVILLCLMGAGYFMVYITTHYELTWLIQTTLARLFLQLWPSILLTALMLVATPEERPS